jgi:co-chaperonin GroES (HSP10)
MKEITAFGKIVVVEIYVAKEKKTESGIILSAAVDKEAQSQAVVVSVGNKVEGINVGDTVIVSRIAGELFELDGRYFRALLDVDVFAKIAETSASATSD